MKSDTTGQLPLSIGTLLSSERESRGIPVEKAAKETRMRAQRIRDMEADDFSAFTNPSYARMFIIAYAKYLGVPMQKVRDLLPERGEVASEGYDYAGHSEPHLPSLRPDIASRPATGRLLPGLIIVAILGVLVAAAFLTYYIVVNLPRLTEERDAAAAPTRTIYLRSAEEVLQEKTIVDEEFAGLGVHLNASVSPTPSTDPLATNLDDPIGIVPRETGTSEDLSSDESTTLENSMPAPTSDPVAPSMPLTSPIESDRAFLLQEPTD
ncbi:MAG: helix-turn-helix domain-containing protein [Chthoniobacterales bacterium]